MARKWIYLDEAGDKAPTELDAKAGETKGETTPEAQANTTRELANSQQTHMQNARFHAGQMKKEITMAKDEYIQKKASEIAERKAAANASKAQEDSSMLDEEEDASIIDNKSSDEAKETLKKDDIKNEKQPLKEFMDFYKFFTCK